jgi:hypothetical protein
MRDFAQIKFGKPFNLAGLSRFARERHTSEFPKCLVIVLALLPGSRLDADAVGGPTMQPRESAPLWVGLTFALMIVGTVIYVTGYFMIEDLLAFFK